VISLALGISRNVNPARRARDKFPFPFVGFITSLIAINGLKRLLRKVLLLWFINQQRCSCLKFFTKSKESNNVDLNKCEFIGQGAIEEGIRRGHIQRTGTGREEANLRRQQHCKMIYL